MEYPKAPTGLDRNDHYTMADQIFNACRLAVLGRVPLPSIRSEADTTKRQKAEKRQHRSTKLGGKRIA